MAADPRPGPAIDQRVVNEFEGHDLDRGRIAVRQSAPIGKVVRLW